MTATDATTDPLRIGDRELGSRLLLGTGGFRSLDALASAIEASGTELVTRRAAARRPVPARLDRRRARPLRGRAAAQHRGLLHRARRGPDRQARPRGVRDELGQARGDRRRAHAAARRARAARGRRGARRRRLHGAPVHQRRPDPRAPAGGRRLRRGDARRLADRLGPGAAEPVQPAPDPRAGDGPGDPRRRRRHRLRRGAGDGDRLRRRAVRDRDLARRGPGGDGARDPARAPRPAGSPTAPGGSRAASTPRPRRRRRAPPPSSRGLPRQTADAGARSVGVRDHAHPALRTAGDRNRRGADRAAAARAARARSCWRCWPSTARGPSAATS